jgi:hypothetical protein
MSNRRKVCQGLGHGWRASNIRVLSGQPGSEGEQDLPSMSRWGWSTQDRTWSHRDFLPAHPAP